MLIYMAVTYYFAEGPFKILIKIVDHPNYYLQVHSEGSNIEKPSCAEVPADLGKESGRTLVNSLTKNERKVKDREDPGKKNGAVLLTEDEQEASCFFLFPVDENEDDEFYIAYYHEDLSIKGGRYVPPHGMKSIPYYLYAESKFLGLKDNHGLQFTANPNENCKFRFVRSVSFSSTSSESS